VGRAAACNRRNQRNLRLAPAATGALG